MSELTDHIMTRQQAEEEMAPAQDIPHRPSARPEDISGAALLSAVEKRPPLHQLCGP